MLTSMRAAAIVAVLVFTTSLLAVQVGGPTEPVTPGATETLRVPVTVTGTQETLVSGPGNIIQAATTMSDPRLSGNVEIRWRSASQYLADGNNDALSGTITVSNDGGTWQGHWVGFADDQGRHHAMAWYEGTGDYDGLRYVEQVAQREQDGLLDLTGLIYEGMAPGTVVPAEVVE